MELWELFDMFWVSISLSNLKLKVVLYLFVVELGLILLFKRGLCLEDASK